MTDTRRGGSSGRGCGRRPGHEDVRECEHPERPKAHESTVRERCEERHGQGQEELLAAAHDLEPGQLAEVREVLHGEPVLRAASVARRRVSPRSRGAAPKGGCRRSRGCASPGRTGGGPPKRFAGRPTRRSRGPKGRMMSNRPSSGIACASASMNTRSRMTRDGRARSSRCEKSIPTPSPGSSAARRSPRPTADLEDALTGRDLHPVEPRETRVVVGAPPAARIRAAGERVPVRNAAPPVLALRAVA